MASLSKWFIKHFINDNGKHCEIIVWQGFHNVADNVQKSRRLNVLDQNRQNVIINITLYEIWKHEETFTDIVVKMIPVMLSINMLTMLYDVPMTFNQCFRKSFYIWCWETAWNRCMAMLMQCCIQNLVITFTWCFIIFIHMLSWRNENVEHYVFQRWYFAVFKTLWQYR